MINKSELIGKRLASELREQLKLVTKMRFTLNDKRTFFVDGGYRSVWPDWFISNNFITTYCNANSCIENLLTKKQALSILVTQSTDLFSKEIIDFILCFENHLREKKVKSIELLDYDNDIIEVKDPTYIVDKLYFLIGFWPWHFYDMGEFNKKVAKDRIFWRNLDKSYYYLKENFHIPEHIAGQEVMLTNIILKDTQRGPAKLGILTNLPREAINNQFLIKELCSWIDIDRRYNDFQARTKMKKPLIPNLIHLHSIDELAEVKDLDHFFDSLSKTVFAFFQNLFVPPQCRDWNPLKIKDVFLRQEGEILRTRKFSLHNIFITNELCEKNDLDYICSRFNELKILDTKERILWFKIGKDKV